MIAIDWTQYFRQTPDWRGSVQECLELAVGHAGFQGILLMYTEDWLSQMFLLCWIVVLSGAFAVLAYGIWRANTLTETLR